MTTRITTTTSPFTPHGPTTNLWSSLLFVTFLLRFILFFFVLNGRKITVISDYPFWSKILVAWYISVQLRKNCLRSWPQSWTTESSMRRFPVWRRKMESIVLWLKIWHIVSNSKSCWVIFKFLRQSGIVTSILKRCSGIFGQDGELLVSSSHLVHSVGFSPDKNILPNLGRIAEAQKDGGGKHFLVFGLPGRASSDRWMGVIWSQLLYFINITADGLGRWIRAFAAEVQWHHQPIHFPPDPCGSPCDLGLSTFPRGWQDWQHSWRLFSIGDWELLEFVRFINWWEWTHVKSLQNVSKRMTHNETSKVVLGNDLEWWQGSEVSILKQMSSKVDVELLIPADRYWYFEYPSCKCR